MRLYCVFLAVAVTLVASTEPALANPSTNQFPISNSTDARALRPSDQDTIAANRFLRVVKTPEEDDNTAESEDRALINEALRAQTHAQSVISTGMKESTILSKLDELSVKLKYKYWLLRKRTPEAAKKLLGLNLVSDMKQHPNYQTWLGYAEAYYKKYPNAK